MSFWNQHGETELGIILSNDAKNLSDAPASKR